MPKTWMACSGWFTQMYAINTAVSQCQKGKSFSAEKPQLLVRPAIAVFLMDSVNARGFARSGVLQHHPTRGLQALAIEPAGGIST